MLSTIMKFIKNHVGATLTIVLLLFGLVWANLTSHTEALLDTFLLAVDSDADGAISDETWFTNFLLISDIDDTPVDEETTAPISSNWAYDHAASTTAHDTIYVNKTQAAIVFDLADASQDVSGGEYFETSDTTTITHFVDSDGDLSEMYDNQLVVVRCLHAGGFDFTTGNLTSPYGENYTMLIGSVEVFQYDAGNTTFTWLTAKWPTASPAGESAGYIAVDSSNNVYLRTIDGEADWLTSTNPAGTAGNTSFAVATAAKTRINRYHQTAHFDPDNQYATYGGILVLDPYTAAAMTVTAIRVYLNEDPTTELTFTAYFKAAAIGYTGGTVIGSGDTASGVLAVTSGWTDNTVPAGSKIWLLIGDDPDATTLHAEVSLDGSYD